MSKHIKESKYLAFFLRHRNETMQIMDVEGYVHICDLIRIAAQDAMALNYPLIQEIVEQDSKGRYLIAEGRTTFGDNGIKHVHMKIRANQGHSLEITPTFEEKIPPAILWHGTTEKNFKAILTDGILKMDRHHVHLSSEEETAWKVGKRHGRPMLLGLNVPEMVEDGVKFYKSSNGVWLTDFVAPQYIKDVRWSKE